MKARFLLNGRRGSALILVITILSTLSVLGGALLLEVYNQQLRVELELDRTKAYFLAEAGIAKALSEIKSQEDPQGDGLGNIPITPFGEGTFQVQHDSIVGELRSTGESNSVKRTLMVKYALN